MKKEDYINQMNDIFRREMNLRHERDDLKIKYSKESDVYQQFKVGEKVMAYIQGKPVPAFVVGFDIPNYSDNEVMLSLVKYTKSGKPSKKNLLYMPEYGDHIEKIG